MAAQPQATGSPKRGLKRGGSRTGHMTWGQRVPKARRNQNWLHDPKPRGPEHGGEFRVAAS